MDIYLTQENHKSLCELFDLQYNPIEFELIEIQPTKYMRGILHPSYGLKQTEEHKKRISLSCKGIHKGKTLKPLSDEHRKSVSLALKGKKYKYSKRLRCSCVICGKEISNNHIGIHYRIHA